MDNILKFSGQLRSQPDNTDDADRRDESAEIVLFPGVRYERWARSHDDESGQQQDTERDFLEL